ncbi:hypothetical protein PGTUg99_014926 [Puccinia graminis f. sp. tritici]|uniref:Uncharacterized protein n=1 Tax=Puccinia graminis f. sp. tritici TaxID=56615 RepID=A0A5B0Q160_PUCGR|nr:hypothetical protein PGTUg99_014926 [Puccinia graminis f. sp. tritici]
MIKATLGRGRTWHKSLQGSRAATGTGYHSAVTNVELFQLPQGDISVHRAPGGTSRKRVGKYIKARPSFFTLCFKMLEELVRPATDGAQESSSLPCIQALKLGEVGGLQP